MVYMRPHELDIKLYRNGAPSLPAKVERINPAGSIAKVTTRTTRRPGSARRPEPRRLSAAATRRRPASVHLSEERPGFLSGLRDLGGKEFRDDRWRSCCDGADIHIKHIMSVRSAAARTTR